MAWRMDVLGILCWGSLGKIYDGLLWFYYVYYLLNGCTMVILCVTLFYYGYIVVLTLQPIKPENPEQLGPAVRIWRFSES